jgi:hypothetical protein
MTHSAAIGSSMSVSAHVTLYKSFTLYHAVEGESSRWQIFSMVGAFRCVMTKYVWQLLPNFIDNLPIIYDNLQDCRITYILGQEVSKTGLFYEYVEIVHRKS